MLRRSGLMLVLVLLFALAMGACGEVRDTLMEEVPEFKDGTVVELPATFKTQLESSLKSIKEKKYEAVKTAQTPAQVKQFYDEGFKKNGWEDKSNRIENDTVALANQLQSTTLIYQKGNKTATVLSLKGSEAAKIGFNNVAQNETLFLLIIGNR
jgi:hypothetical protein